MLSAYGLTIASSILLATLLAAKDAEKRGLDPDFIWNGLLWILPFGIIGARLYHVLHYWDFYSGSPILIPQIWLGGLGILGGLAGGFIGLLLYKKLAVGSWKLVTVLDILAPSLALAQGFGRWANVFNGELLPYAYLESIWNLLLFLLLVRLRWGVSRRPGRIFLVYLLGSGLGRFILEPLHPLSWHIAGVSVPQLGFLLVLAVTGMVVLIGKIKNDFRRKVNQQ